MQRTTEGVESFNPRRKQSRCKKNLRIPSQILNRGTSLSSKLFLLNGKVEGIGKFNVNSTKPLFVMDTPPPYPSGRPWHVGGASHYSQIDMIAILCKDAGV